MVRRSGAGFTNFDQAGYRNASALLKRSKRNAENGGPGTGWPTRGLITSDQRPTNIVSSTVERECTDGHEACQSQFGFSAARRQMGVRASAARAA